MGTVKIFLCKSFGVWWIPFLLSLLAWGISCIKLVPLGLWSDGGKGCFCKGKGEGGFSNVIITIEIYT